MKTSAIQSHDHAAEILGRAVIDKPTPATLEAVTTWHLTRFWRQLAHEIKQPRHRRMAYVGE